jgi:hypothetical protein
VHDRRRIQAPPPLAALDGQADGAALAQADGDDEAAVSHAGVLPALRPA